MSPLLKIAKDGVNKEPMRFDSILALYTLGMIAKDDSSIEDKLASENSWKDLFGEANPVLLSIDVAVRQNLEDTCIIAKFCGFLLSKVIFQSNFTFFPTEFQDHFFQGHFLGQPEYRDHYLEQIFTKTHTTTRDPFHELHVLKSCPVPGFLLS